MKGFGGNAPGLQATTKKKAADSRGKTKTKKQAAKKGASTNSPAKKATKSPAKARATARSKGAKAKQQGGVVAMIMKLPSKLNPLNFFRK